MHNVERTSEGGRVALIDGRRLQAITPFAIDRVLAIEVADPFSDSEVGYRLLIEDIATSRAVGRGRGWRGCITGHFRCNGSRLRGCDIGTCQGNGRDAAQREEKEREKEQELFHEKTSFLETHRCQWFHARGGIGTSMLVNSGCPYLVHVRLSGINHA